jgi:serine protease Do
MNKLTHILLALYLLPAVGFGDPGKTDAEINYQKIYETIDRVLVTVEYKAEMTFMGQSDEIEGRVPGLAVEPQGTIIFDGTSLGAGSHFAVESFSAPRIEKPKSVKVKDYQGNEYDAEFIGVDQFSSIAFCRLPDSAKETIPAAKFSRAELELGEEIVVSWLLPKGFEPRFQMSRSVITNILTKPEKYYLTGELTPDFMMTPVLTTSGDLVGVVTSIASNGGRTLPFDAGEAFGTPVGIMPVDRFEELLAKPPAEDEFKRGWMGIALQALDPDVAAFWGVDVSGGIIVSDVTPHSPAEKSGLIPGDFIVGIDKMPIEITDDANLSIFQKMVSEMGAGGELNMAVIRPSEGRVDSINLTLILGELPISAGDAPSYEDKNFDLTIRDLVFADYNARNLDPAKIKGVIVDKLERGGWAAVEGVRPGDIIMKINDGTVESVDECKKALVNIEKDKESEVVFMVWRSNKTKFINVKTHWE